MTADRPLYAIVSKYNPNFGVPIVRYLWRSLSEKGRCLVLLAEDPHVPRNPAIDHLDFKVCPRVARFTGNRPLDFFIVRANELRYLLFATVHLRWRRARLTACLALDEWSYTACVLSGIPFDRIVYYACEQPAQLEYRKRSVLYGLRDHMVRKTMRRSALLVAPNRQRLRLIASAFRMPTEKTLVIRNAVPLRVSGAAPAEGIASEDADPRLTVFYQGRVSPHTCQDVLFRLIEAYHVRVRIIVAGYVRPGSEEEFRLNDYNQKGFATYLGSIPSSELDRYRRIAELSLVLWDGRVVRSLRYCEPNKLYELIADGIPVICTPNPTLRELVARHHIGWCLKDYDGGGLDEIIEGILADPVVLERIRSNCLAAARETLNFEAQAAPLLARVAAMSAPAAGPEDLAARPPVRRMTPPVRPAASGATRPKLDDAGTDRCKRNGTGP
ncbi:MAG: glycosyltransferase [Phycisphaerae bacterium]